MRLQGQLPLVTITSYEMMQRLTCDACKGRVAAPGGGGSGGGGGGAVAGVCVGLRPPCRDPQNCMAGQHWKVVIVDGE